MLIELTKLYEDDEYYNKNINRVCYLNNFVNMPKNIYFDNLFNENNVSISLLTALVNYNLKHMNDANSIFNKNTLFLSKCFELIPEKLLNRNISNNDKIFFKSIILSVNDISNVISYANHLDNLDIVSGFSLISFLIFNEDIVKKYTINKNDVMKNFLMNIKDVNSIFNETNKRNIFYTILNNVDTYFLSYNIEDEYFLEFCNNMMKKRKDGHYIVKSYFDTKEKIVNFIDKISSLNDDSNKKIEFLCDFIKYLKLFNIDYPDLFKEIGITFLNNVEFSEVYEFSYARRYDQKYEEVLNLLYYNINIHHVLKSNGLKKLWDFNLYFSDRKSKVIKSDRFLLELDKKIKDNSYSIEYYAEKTILSLLNNEYFKTLDNKKINLLNNFLLSLSTTDKMNTVILLCGLSNVNNINLKKHIIDYISNYDFYKNFIKHLLYFENNNYGDIESKSIKTIFKLLDKSNLLLKDRIKDIIMADSILTINRKIILKDLNSENRLFLKFMNFLKPKNNKLLENKEIVISNENEDIVNNNGYDIDNDVIKNKLLKLDNQIDMIKKEISETCNLSVELSDFQIYIDIHYNTIDKFLKMIKFSTEDEDEFEGLINNFNTYLIEVEEQIKIYRKKVIDYYNDEININIEINKNKLKL